MGRKKPAPQIQVQVFGTPEAIEREIVKDQQVRFDEETIIWGDNDDSLPVRILQAVNQSPTATSCLGKVSDYMQGSKFTDEGLMKMPVDDDGTTLWDLHKSLCDYMAKLEGFSVRFTFNREGSITQAFLIGMENCRFVRPQNKQSRKIRKIKYNPYIGSALFNNSDTETYGVWEPKQELRFKEISENLESYKGQIYFCGTPRAPYKFYPVPKYWSGSFDIYADAAISTFIKKGLDNGFFQSVLINMIGDPTVPSKNPKYQVKKVGTDGTVRYEWDGKTTVGDEFSAMMSSSFSGYDKAFKAMVMWSMNQDNAAKIQPFPQSQNFQLVDTIELRTIRKIAIATEVPAILANLPQQASSLGSDGESMNMAVELIQDRVREPQVTLEQFYNEVLLSNHVNKTAARVKIVNHSPLKNQFVVPDKVWEWMNDQEKASYVKKNLPDIEVMRTTTVTATPDQTLEAKAADPVFKNLKTADIDQISSIVRRVEKGKLTYDQGKELMMQKFGFNEEQIKAWLKDPEEAVII